MGSGSGGNSTLVDTGKTRLLVDAGFGMRSLRRRLRDAGLSLNRLDAVLISHGHRDHVCAAAAIAKHFNCPVFASQGTRREAADLQSFDRVETFEPLAPFQIGDLRCLPFPVSHDAGQPVGFRLSWEGIHGTVLTDIGELTEAAAVHLGRCDWMVVESNHDEEMVKLGPYPWHLKKRILGSGGHLSNQALAVFLSGEFDGQARHIFLAHLSRNNNHPELAVESATCALSRRNGNGRPPGHVVYLTHQDKPSIVLSL